MRASSRPRFRFVLRSPFGFSQYCGQVAAGDTGRSEVKQLMAVARGQVDGQGAAEPLVRGESAYILAPGLPAAEHH